MIFSLLKKYWKNIFDALIIIGLILLVFILNPWKIFEGRLRTHNTANNVTAIREIGELVTAEYYGEAISTINQAKLQLIYSDNINATADTRFREIKQQLLTIYSSNIVSSDLDKTESFWKFKWFRRAKREEEKTLNTIRTKLKLNQDKSDPTIYTILEYYYLVNTNTNTDLSANSTTELNDVLLALYQEIINNTENLNDADFEKYLQEGLPEYNDKLFSDYYYDKKKENLGSNQELSMIGRGWVKAGFNFGHLDESNFFFDKERGIVHLFGVHAEILNADINPWFIPEKKIPGFQIIQANNKVDFSDAIIVKKYCIEKLRKMALDAGILKQAEMQGKETLKNFIGLLTGTTINEVYFHYDKFTVLSKEMLNDEFISYEESLMLDTLIGEQTDSLMKLDLAKKNHTANLKYMDVKTVQMQASLANLKKVPFEELGHYYNRMSSLVFRVTADSVLTYDELKEIEDYRWDFEKIFFNSDSRQNLENRLWYTHELEFINEYNKAIDVIKHKTNYYGNLRYKDTTDVNGLMSFKKNLKGPIKELNTKHFKNIVMFTYLDKFTENADTLTRLKYPVNVSNDWENILNNKKNIHSVQKSKSNVTDTLFMGYAILSQAGINGNEIKVLPVSLNNNIWRINPVSSLKSEQKLFLEYFINYYKRNNTGFFIRINNRLKKTT